MKDDEDIVQAAVKQEEQALRYASFNNGYLMAYHTVIEFMKNQTEIFDIAQEEVGLAVE